jgi:UDP-GlcNAc:undecaprenyl-phosphate GlcNAc-1-phosphate transferase
MNRTSFAVLGFGASVFALLGVAVGTEWTVPLLAIAITAASAVLLKNLAPRLGLIDQPQGHKTHEGNVPVVGGLAMYVALALCLPMAGVAEHTVMAVLSACGLLVVVGGLDDRFHLPVWIRFGAQITAALIMIHWGGVALTDLGQLVGEETFTLGRWSVFMTVVATVGVINSLNMADGLDGLAGTLSLVTFAVAAIIASSGHPDLVVLAMLACALLVGFLAFNAPFPGRVPGARLFMGDAGSMMLGLLVAWLMIDLAQGPERAMPPITALWLFAIPLLDTLSVMLRRLLRGKSPFSPDQEHLHHVLIVAGYSRPMVVVLAAVGALLFAGLGLLMLKAGLPEHVQFGIALGVFILVNVALRHAWKLQKLLQKI